MVHNTVRRNTKYVVAILLTMIAMVSQSLVMAQTPTATVEIMGSVTAMTTSNITVGTQVFDISSAEIKAGVAVGRLVKVHASQNAAGQWVATEVELAQPNASQTPAPNVTPTASPINAFEITGEITVLTDSSITVGGHTIDISGAEIKNSLAVNDRVKVHVIVLNGQWIAREVESASIPVTVTVPANCTPTQPAGWVTYTIQAGDTLSSVAFGSGSTVQAIANANCIRDSRNIQAGQTIFVPQQPVLVPGNGGHHGQDDGPGHDLNDDHGGNNATDDHGNHNGSDDSGNHSGSDDSGHNGGSNGGSGGNSGGGSDDGSGHG